MLTTLYISYELTPLENYAYFTFHTLRGKLDTNTCSIWEAKKMKQFQFPRSRIVSPEHRQDVRESAAAQPLIRPCHDEQRLQEFQALLEHSIHNNQVIRIVSIVGNKKNVTTGIVRKADPNTFNLYIQTLEGLRTIPIPAILDIS
jgi:hypothetical protein